MVRRGSVDKSAFAACFDWAFQGKVDVVFDIASGLLIDEHEPRMDTINGRV